MGAFEERAHRASSATGYLLYPLHTQRVWGEKEVISQVSFRRNRKGKGPDVLVLAMDTYTSIPSPPQTGILLP
jgi:hypothetical protein